jgi:uncharacterized metal-binding protein
MSELLKQLACMASSSMQLIYSCSSLGNIPQLLNLLPRLFELQQLLAMQEAWPFAAPTARAKSQHSSMQLTYSCSSLGNIPQLLKQLRQLLGVQETWPFTAPTERAKGQHRASHVSREG